VKSNLNLALLGALNPNPRNNCMPQIHGDVILIHHRVTQNFSITSDRKPDLTNICMQTLDENISLSARKTQLEYVQIATMLFELSDFVPKTHLVLCPHFTNKTVSASRKM
jgi:hypothetical protein